MPPNLAAPYLVHPPRVEARVRGEATMHAVPSATSQVRVATGAQASVSRAARRAPRTWGALGWEGHARESSYVRARSRSGARHARSRVPSRATSDDGPSGFVNAAVSLTTASLVDAIPDANPADRKQNAVDETAAYEPALVAFTGGTAFNGIIDELLNLTSRVTHVIPVSDDGGSTAEIVRVLGGPAVGDLRSRCLRLSDESTDEARAVKALLAHRLHATDSAAAKAEWYRIQEGDHALWENISEPYADIIRSFLLYFHAQVSAAKTDAKFDFVNGSVGNFFFAGARMFFRSMEAAILLYSRISRAPAESVVVPNILLDENVRVALGAELQNGSTIRGQNEISHPTPDPKSFSKASTASEKKPDFGGDLVKKSKTVAKAREFINQGKELKKAGKAKAASSTFWMEAIERGAIPEVSASEFWGGLEESSAGHQSVRDALKQGDILSAGELINSRLFDLTTRPLSVWDIDKVVSGYEVLESPIKRVFYLSTEDPTSLAPVYPKANPAMLRGVEACDGVVYGMGSLYTSIVPSLILEGVGEAIAAKKGPKVLILNGDQDRETGSMSASGYVAAVVDALNRAYEPKPGRRLSHAVSDYVTVVIAPRGGGMPLDLGELHAMGVRTIIEVDAKKKPSGTGAEYDVPALIQALRECFAPPEGEPIDDT